MFVAYVYWFTHILCKSSMAGARFLVLNEVEINQGSTVYPSALRLFLPSPLHRHPPLLLHPLLLVILHIARSLLQYPTLDIWSQSLSLHSPFSPPFNPLRLHTHLQEVRIAPRLYLVPLFPLSPAILIRKVPRPHCPPPHRAPWTSVWSSDMTVNYGKYSQI